ncbi:MAG: hypothetical protein COA53_00145 [Rhodobacteraceae bacterium]|nr:MAG: hypothetical protein COA53_00145 [Paracoccaceae bacterium]
MEIRFEIETDVPTVRDLHLSAFPSAKEGIWWMHFVWVLMLCLIRLCLTTLVECAKIGTLSLSMLAPVGRYAVKVPRI